MRVYVILDDHTSLEHPLGEAVDVLLSREDAERFIEEVRGDDSESRGEASDQGAGA